MTIGQRVAPSFADVKRINMAYCNCESVRGRWPILWFIASCTTALYCLNGGYTDPKVGAGLFVNWLLQNCSQCRCPDGFGGTLCDRADNAPSSCGPGDLTATGELQTIQAVGAIKCPYVITAPPGKKVFFQFGTFTFTYWTPCTVDYLEIKYGSEFVSTGARCVFRVSWSFLFIGFAETSLWTHYQKLIALSLFTKDLLTRGFLWVTVTVRINWKGGYDVFRPRRPCRF